MKIKSTLALILPALAVISGSACAATLQIDFSTAATPAQSGWETFGGTSADASQNKSFSGYTDLAAGNITITMSGIAFNRLYKNGFTGTADDFPGTDLDSMYSDLIFRNNATADIDITIAGLKAGTYQITSYHMTSPVTTASLFDLIKTDSTGTSTVGNFAMGQGNTMTFNPTIITYNVVSNGSDAITLKMDATFIGTGGNTGGWFGYNGMEIAVPEPSSALLGGLGMLALLRRRR